MSIDGLRILLLFAVMLVSTVGCAGVPPVPEGATVQSHSDEDEYEGKLFDRLMGRGQSASTTTPPNQAAPSGVIPVSATEPIASTAVRSDVRESDDADDDSGFELSDLSPTKVYNDVKAAAGYGPDEAKAQAFLKEGEALFAKKEYDAAADKFKAAAGRWPDSPLQEDALFMKAESHFFADDYSKAQSAYEALLKKYDNSRHLDTTVKRVFRIGQYWEDMHRKEAHWPVTPNVLDGTQPTFDTFGHALKCYELVRLHDPTGPLADDALMATANAYFAKSRFEDAAFHYDVLRDEYPDSEHQAQAHVLAVQAKLQVYQGANYDDTPLKEADEIADQALKQFRGQLADEAPRLAEARNRVVSQLAERDWTMGQYYETKEYFGAARMYYNSILEKYPRTPFAEKARERIAQIQGEPDVPPNRYKWLTDRFQSDD
ncbi:MAG TPA: outer membrane protein assembly factor BamD [Thermoguttaceae bacterium]|nr:outer membrane protein assembly factor BamD [Thermoguttaceae bacterium]